MSGVGGGPAADAGVVATGLVARLSAEEKIALLHQHQPAIDRLGLAAFQTGCEALHGVAWLGRATVFPQAVGLGATWDRELLRRVGEAVSIEVRAFRHDPEGAGVRADAPGQEPMVSLNVWSPVVNLLRDPRWGRNEEGYSEDPYATAQLATAYCRGLRGEHPVIWRTAPVLKHFLAYNAETERDVVDMRVPARVLHEYELPAFRGPIEAGVVAGVMPGYNLTNGIPNHVHPLLKQALRAWRPDLVICSDAQAPSNLVERQKYLPTHPQAHAAALKAGVDSFTENATDAQPTIERFTQALNQGLISEADLDAAVGRILAMRARTGEFDPSADPYAAIRADVIASPEHNALALQAAREAIVLLKNDRDALPLPLGRDVAAEPAGSIALIGHLGTRVLTDWYSGQLPYTVSIADALRARLGAQAVTAVDGADIITLHAANTRFGPYRHQDWGTNAECPVPLHTLQALENSKYLTLAGPDSGHAAAAADTPDGWFVNELWEFYPATTDQAAAGAGAGAGKGDGYNGYAGVDDGGEIVIRANAAPHRRYLRVDEDGNLLADAERPEQATRFRLDILSRGVDEARAMAAQARHAIVVLGNEPHINGRETIDRDSIALPPMQQAVLQAVRRVNPNTTLVLVSSYPYDISWAEQHVPAILWSAHGGQEQGNAIADVLTGAYNPAGRVPQTWYGSDAHLPRPDDYDVIGSGWTYQYSPHPHLYAFGHGLSYTTFHYAPPAVHVYADPAGARIVEIRATISNTGTRSGDEVVQLYSRALDATIPTARRRLQGFQRVTLQPGQSHTVTFEVPEAQLGFWSAQLDAYRTIPGRHEFAIGSSSVDLHHATDVHFD